MQCMFSSTPPPSTAYISLYVSILISSSLMISYCYELLFFSFPGNSGDAQHFALEPIPPLISMHCLIRDEWRKIKSVETGLTKPKSDDAECRLKSVFIKFHILMSNSYVLFKSFCSYGFQSWKYMQSHKTSDISMPLQVQVSCQ